MDKKDEKAVKGKRKKGKDNARAVKKQSKKPVSMKGQEKADSLKAQKKNENKFVFTVGKRKLAVARCTIRPGVGRVLVNLQPIETIENEVVRLMISEPFIVLGNDKWKAYDFSVNVRGGGAMGQSEAARQSIARGIVKLFGNDAKAKFLEYNRAFLAFDPRRTEPHKPPRSSQGPRRYKQRSKR